MAARYEQVHRSHPNHRHDRRLVHLVLGMLFWTDVGKGLVALRAIIGSILVLSLWAMAFLAGRAGAPIGPVVLVVAWGLILPEVGLGRTSLPHRSLYRIVHVVHPARGITTIVLAALSATTALPHKAEADNAADKSAGPCGTTVRRGDPLGRRANPPTRPSRRPRTDRKETCGNYANGSAEVSAILGAATGAWPMLIRGRYEGGPSCSGCARIAPAKAAAGIDSAAGSARRMRAPCRLGPDEWGGGEPVG